MKYEVELIDSDRCFEGFLRVVRYRLRHSLFAGGWSKPVERERLEFIDAAAALLYDPSSDRVVLVEQFRIGLLGRTKGAWSLEPVGGMVHPGEDPSDVVRREAMEEAGCVVTDLIPIGTYHASPGTTADRVALYCARVDAAEAAGVHGLAEEDEETRVVVVDRVTALNELFSGTIDASAAIICLQWLALNKNRVDDAWLLAVEPTRSASADPVRKP